LVDYGHAHGNDVDEEDPIHVSDEGDRITVDRAAAQLTPSPPVHLAVAGRRTLDAGGTLPVVLGVPAVLALAMVAARLRRRRAGTRPAGGSDA
jgi:hypothetical protein